jgi:transposase
MNPSTEAVQRVIGLDSHPDSFTAATLTGSTPASAVVQKTFNKVPLANLIGWATKHTTGKDRILLEASGNSFHIVRQLAAIQREAIVLESTHLGKLKEAHANNDKISAVRIAKAYLAGTAKTVWVPDTKTQQRRELFQAHRKSVKRTTQMRNRIKSYLSDRAVRLPARFPLAQPKGREQLRTIVVWTEDEWAILEGMLAELHHAEAQRARWRSLIARQVLSDPLLLSMVRLCGVRDLVAFAVGAVVGDIKRFANPKKLVQYIGLSPCFDDSGKGKWSGGVGGHGRRDLRDLLLESAHAILRSRCELAHWARRLLARKGEKNLVAAAVARKLAVALWYLLMGRWTQMEELDALLRIKIGKIITALGPDLLKATGKTRPQIREAAQESLKSGRTYRLDPDKKYTPQIRLKSESSDPANPSEQCGKLAPVSG